MRNKVGRRKCEMWISNNKVLIGGSMKKPHARNPNFETEETKLLISLWGDPKVQKTLITTHKKHPVIAKLAESMREHGYHRSPEEINTRIKNLKCFYNRIKKDIEMGVTTEPTWRHYTAMDEILTRPIFGNRVQQPHLQNAQKNGDDGEPKELRPEDLLSVEEEEMDDDSLTDLDGSIVPKEEPIDIDDMEEIGGDGDADRNDQEIDDVNDIFPKLSAYLQLASNSALKGAPNAGATSKSPLLIDIKTSPPSSPISEPVSPTGPTTSATTTSASSTVSSSTSITTAPSNTATISGSKISLVPTNILMKPSASVQSSTAAPTQFSFKPQQFICAKPSGSTGTVLTTTNNGMPMKVLLVNTLQKPNGVSGSNTVTVAAKPIISTPLTTRSLVNIQPKPGAVPISTSNIVQSTYQTRSTTAASAQQASKSQTLLSSNKYLCSGSSSNTEPVTKRQVTFKQKATPGFRTFLSQLVQLQQRQLEVSQQRLEVERERLDYERKTGDKILQMITSLLDGSKCDTKDEPKESK